MWRISEYRWCTYELWSVGGLSTTISPSFLWLKGQKSENVYQIICRISSFHGNWTEISWNLLQTISLFSQISWTLLEFYSILMTLYLACAHFHLILFSFLWWNRIMKKLVFKAVHKKCIGPETGNCRPNNEEKDI